MNKTELTEKIEASSKKLEESKKELTELYTDLLKLNYEKIKEVIEPIGNFQLNISYNSNDEGGMETYYNLTLDGYDVEYYDDDDTSILYSCYEDLEMEEPTKDQVKDFNEFLQTFDSILNHEDLCGIDIIKECGIEIVDGDY